MCFLSNYNGYTQKKRKHGTFSVIVPEVTLLILRGQWFLNYSCIFHSNPDSILSSCPNFVSVLPREQYFLPDVMCSMYFALRKNIQVLFQLLIKYIAFSSSYSGNKEDIYIYPVQSFIHTYFAFFFAPFSILGCVKTRETFSERITSKFLSHPSLVFPSFLRRNGTTQT